MLKERKRRFFYRNFYHTKRKYLFCMVFIFNFYFTIILIKFFFNRFIIELGNLGCPALKNLPRSIDVSCCNHEDVCNSVCAARNAHMLKSWMSDNKKILDIDEGDCGCDHALNFSLPSFFKNIFYIIINHE